jgi:hypothetical protein
MISHFAIELERFDPVNKFHQQKITFRRATIEAVRLDCGMYDVKLSVVDTDAHDGKIDLCWRCTRKDVEYIDQVVHPLTVETGEGLYVGTYQMNFPHLMYLIDVITTLIDEPDFHDCPATFKNLETHTCEEFVSGRDILMRVFGLHVSKDEFCPFYCALLDSISDLLYGSNSSDSDEELVKEADEAVDSNVTFEEEDYDW